MRPAGKRDGTGSIRSAAATTSAPSPWLAPDVTAEAFAAGHRDADGKPDLVSTTAGAERTGGFNQTEAPAAEPAFVTQTLACPGVGAQIAVAIADVDGDGKSDVASSGLDGVCVVRRGGGARDFLAPQARSATGPNTSLAVGDLSGDGRADLVTVAGPSAVFFAQTTAGALGPPPRIQGLGGPEGAITTADIDGDGLGDAVMANGVALTTVWLQGTGAVLAGHGFSVPSVAFAVTVGDVTDDGYLDLIVMHHQGGSLLVGR